MELLDSRRHVAPNILEIHRPVPARVHADVPGEAVRRCHILRHQASVDVPVQVPTPVVALVPGSHGVVVQPNGLAFDRDQSLVEHLCKEARDQAVVVIAPDQSVSRV